MIGGFISVKVADRSGRKLLRRKTHSSEYRAGIFVSGIDTLLIRHAVLRCGYEYLSGAYDTYHREETEGAVKSDAIVIIIAKAAVHTCEDLLRDVGTSAAALSAVISNAAGKHDRIDNFAYRRRGVRTVIRGGGIGAAEAVYVGIAAEYTDLSFPSVEDHALFTYCYSFEFFRSSLSHTPLAIEFCIESYVDLIEASVELYGFNVYATVDYSRRFYSDGGRVFDYTLTAFCQKYSGVFKAVLIAAAVKDPVAVYSRVFLCVVRYTAGTHFVIGHRISFLLFY